jgi:hypothetical protein
MACNVARAGATGGLCLREVEGLRAQSVKVRHRFAAPAIKYSFEQPYRTQVMVVCSSTLENVAGCSKGLCSQVSWIVLYMHSGWIFCCLQAVDSFCSLL